MLDQLTKLVSQYAQDAIVKNDAIPNQHNNAAIQEVASSIFDGLQGNVLQGNMQEVVSMFQGQGASGLTSNPMVASIASQIAGNLASKFGVSPQAAQSIVASVLPQIMNQFVNKTNDPNDSDFDLQDMMRGFSGDNGFNIGDLLGGSSQRGGSSGGGIGDVLGKMFGN